MRQRLARHALADLSLLTLVVACGAGLSMVRSTP
jgi:hypothetical protein